MFTGIIEEIGTVHSIKQGADSAQLSISAHLVLEGTKIGDSIAVNGVCLTVTSLDSARFTADMMSETLKRTCFIHLSIGTKVNLERALPANGRFGGHIVSGHIDGIGTIKKIEKNDIALLFTIQAPTNITRLIVEKGSVTIDGISLTVTQIHGQEFSVSLIPHTVGHTNLHTKKIGSPVHIETDIIGKYVEKLLHEKQTSNNAEKDTPKSTLTEAFLRQNGF